MYSGADASAQLLTHCCQTRHHAPDKQRQYSANDKLHGPVRTKSQQQQVHINGCTKYRATRNEIEQRQSRRHHRGVGEGPGKHEAQSTARVEDRQLVQGADQQTEYVLSDPFKKGWIAHADIISDRSPPGPSVCICADHSGSCSLSFSQACPRCLFLRGNPCLREY